MTTSEMSWWLDWSALPEHFLWARLSTQPDGKAEILDCDGKRHAFPSVREARLWLLEDEYASLTHLIEEGEVSANVVPPSGRTEAELVRAMRSSAGDER